MPAHAADLDRERVAGAQHGSGFPTDDAAGKVRPKMKSKGVLRWRISREHPLLAHPFRAGAAFFCGLEDESDGPVEQRFVGLEDGRCAQEHAGVPIVATGVHLALHRRLEGNLRKLPDGQGVDVGAQGHARRVSSAQLGHHAVAARPRNALVLPGVERPAGLVGHSQALEGALDDL